MANGMMDVTKYFGRPRDVPYGSRYEIFLDPRSGQLQGRKYRTGKFSNVWDAFDPSALSFRADAFASAFGLPTESPEGDPLFSSKGTFGSVSDVFKKNFGTTLTGFLGMSPGKRESVFRSSQENLYKDVFDPITGLPNRPPKNEQEAMMWQWQSDEYARRMGERQMYNAVRAIQFGLGQVSRSSPYSLSTMMSPLFGQLSQAYQGFQYQAPDYSAFLRPDISAEGPSASYGGYPKIGPASLQYSNPNIPSTPGRYLPQGV